MTATTDSIPVLAALIGQPQPFGPKGEPSAYFRHPVDGPLTIGPVGIEGDQPADTVNHGGVDKSIHHYPYDHYAAFAAERPEHANLLGEGFGAFGENISTLGWTEEDVCLGDRFRLGTAELEISQGRAPCWKLGHRFGDPTMVEAVVRTRRAGWYYRVLRTGRFRRGDALERLERPYPDWPLTRLFGVIVVGDGAPEDLAELMAMPQLGASWRRRAERRVAALAGGA